MTTENRDYNLPDQGELDWHVPINENWQLIDEDVQAALDAASGGDESVTGIDSARTNVGALVGGTYHDSAYSGGGYGVVFAASDLHIDSVVVDADLEGISDADLTIELRQYRGGADDPPVVASQTTTLSGGPERVDLGFTVPESGASDADPNDEYVLQRGAPSGDPIPLRRRFADENDWSTADYTDERYSDPDVDFLQGTINTPTATWDEPVGSWYYFFDWLVGSSERTVTAPVSTDVDEIYMRPRDPEEEFENVSPRALWIDTSEYQ
ncbi:hypothetical protein [Haloarcula sediminis]|uniref:hypothetical protein n=1 Tax=Haloarcula sediminis TaxID=3111777 RepID=UPI002D764FB4|nr:hypothetical protein [Haloarcula sp. CK38]